jgi:predicted RNA-binding Zn-ribbon protein involved in translation (DUF1610 family)
MKTWICPKCSAEVKANAKEVAHKCPNNKNKMTNFEEISK